MTGSVDLARCTVLLLMSIALAGLGGAAFGAPWAPVPGNMMTRWAAEVSPDNVLPEYPRPTMTRADWLNLNSLWQFRKAVADEKPPVGQTLPEQILVPFAVESALSGLKRHEERMWYRRTFEVPEGWTGKRVLLHFGAVDWLSTVNVNGKQIGSHRGGYDAFSYDITSALNPTGPQELIVYVYDPTEPGEQPRGKQVLKPFEIWFSPVSGIWQTVWLEPVPAARIASLHSVPDVDAGALRLSVDATNARPDDTVQALVIQGTEVVAQATGRAGSEMTIPVPNPRLWSVEDPYLYRLKVSLRRGGAVIDEVGSYFGMRKIALGKDAKGVTRPMLNGEFVFQVGPLDQGYWPDGLYTAPTDEALRYDIEMTKRLGFNMTRKHVKVEPERWYYWCDKLGLLVWQDMPNGAARTLDGKMQHEREQARMVEGRWNHPSIILWVVFNEGWGQFDTERLTRWVQERDPSRLVTNASGWVDTPSGDIVDMHIYPGPDSPKPEPNRAAVCGEFGGIWIYDPEHAWIRDGWVYSPTRGFEEGTRSYIEMLRKVYALKDNPGMSAAVYTEITDVEMEIAGLMTYDRAAFKFDPDRVADANRGIFPVPAPLTMHLRTADPDPTAWRYTNSAPGFGWTAPAFNDAGWSTGAGGFGADGTPGGTVRTAWNTSDIWLRREFTLPEQSLGIPFLVMHHDEDVEVYLNGVLAARDVGYMSRYLDFPIAPAATATLRPGRNVLAIHCRQTGGGQYIDAGIGFRPSPTPAAKEVLERAPLL